MIVTVINILSAFIVPIVVLTLPAYWFCVFFKKKSLLQRFCGEEDSMERFNFVFAHSFLCSAIAFFYIISLLMQENVFGDKFTFCAWLGMLITGSLLLALFVFKVVGFLERVHNKIKPS